MAVINTNMSATIAQNSLVKNERMMSKAMEQLSTGRRINTASDDAAGMAISSVMTSQIKGLAQSVRNANDAVSMMQTADGAYSEVENMLQRIRELSIQAATDSYTDTQRSYAQQEVSALLSQINTIGENTQFNGAALVDGSAGSSGTVTYQVGSEAGQTITHTFDAISGGTVTSVLATADNTGGPSVVELDISALADVEGTHKVAGVFAGTYYEMEFTVAVAGTGATTFSLNGAAEAASFTVTPSDSSTTGDLTIAIDDTAGSEVISITSASTGDDLISFQNQNVAVQAGNSGIYAEVATIDVSTRSGASGALASIDSALAAVAAERADLGAGINRLTYAMDNLANEQANTEAARSRILDADYATATTELARTQIIQQAGTAMLAQANQLPQTVLSLLQ